MRFKFHQTLLVYVKHEYKKICNTSVVQKQFIFMKDFKCFTKMDQHQQI